MVEQVCTIKELEIVVCGYEDDLGEPLRAVRTIKELEIVVCGYEDDLGEPLRAVREAIEREWSNQLDAEGKRGRRKRFG